MRYGLDRPGVARSRRRRRQPRELGAAEAVGLLLVSVSAESIERNAALISYDERCSKWSHAALPMMSVMLATVTDGWATEPPHRDERSAASTVWVAGRLEGLPSMMSELRRPPIARLDSEVQREPARENSSAATVMGVMAVSAALSRPNLGCISPGAVEVHDAPLRNGSDA